MQPHRQLELLQGQEKEQQERLIIQFVATAIFVALIFVDDDFCGRIFAETRAVVAMVEGAAAIHGVSSRC